MHGSLPIAQCWFHIGVLRLLQTESVSDKARRKAKFGGPANN